MQAEEEEMPRTAQVQAGPATRVSEELFPESDVRREWSAVCRVGPGLQNLGNTCFMNSVLQCLTHTPPLAQGLMHSQLKKMNGWSMLQLTQDHIRKALQGKQMVLAPISHFKTMRRICRSFRMGRQEDAHEYLIGLLDAMHEGQLEGVKPKPPRSVQETSMIFRIFAGRIRSQVKCIECGFESNTVDPFLDISLEINRASTLEKALQRFTATEYLEGENKYKCPRQSCLVRAAKRIAIDRAPNVLVIQFKRFEFSMYGQKVAKKVDFGTTLDLAPYMCDRRSPPQMYQLYGVLVHQGHSVHSGHYYCFVRAANGLWHQMNDNCVSQVSERVVLAQKAYILFYIRKDDLGIAAIPVSPRASQWPQSEPSGSKRKGDDGRAGKQEPPSGQDLSKAGKRQLEASPRPTAKRKRGSQGAQHWASEAEGNAVRVEATAVATRPDSGQVPVGGVDPELLRQRLQSHSEATPSGESFRTAVESPGSPGSGRYRYSGSRLPQSAGIGSPSRSLGGARSAPYLGAGMGLSRSMRKLRLLKAIHSQVGIKSLSANSTPPVSGSPGLRGSSPVSSLSLNGTSLPAGGRSSRLKPKGEAVNGLEPAKGANGIAKQPAHSAPIDRSQGEAPQANGVHAVSHSEGMNGWRGTTTKYEVKAPSMTASTAAKPLANSHGVRKSEKAIANSKLSIDPNKVKDMLGLTNGAQKGPAGEQHWDHVEQTAKAEAETLLQSVGLKKAGLDEYEREYDRGKTKKVKGMRHTDSWDAGNVFQEKFNTKARGSGDSRSHGRQRLTRH